VARVVPFTCWRPPCELAEKVAAAPYDTLSRAEAAREIDKRPLSFLRLDRPAALFSPEVDEYDARVYAHARAELNAWYEQGVMIPDNPSFEPAYFIYRLTQLSHRQTGLVACASIADYQNGIIKRHENTRAKKESDRVEHIMALEAHTGPVLLTYPSVQELDILLERQTIEAKPLYDFVASDGVRHEFWRVDEKKTMEQIQSCFESISTLYIADGHHRAAAAAQVAKWYSEKQQKGQAAAQHFLVAAFGSNELQVLDYNRVISDLAGKSSRELLEAIEGVVDVELQGAQPYPPSKRGELVMYLEGLWYRLNLREAERPQDVVDGLDVALLHSSILAPILCVEDPRSDPRITYIGGARGLSELAKRADNTHGVAFALYPCSFSELFAVANEDRLMPPKSTWFELKPRSGLAIPRIKPHLDGTLPF